MKTKTQVCKRLTWHSIGHLGGLKLHWRSSGGAMHSRRRSLTLAPGSSPSAEDPGPAAAGPNNSRVVLSICSLALGVTAALLSPLVDSGISTYTKDELNHVRVSSSSSMAPVALTIHYNNQLCTLVRCAHDLF